MKSLAPELHLPRITFDSDKLVVTISPDNVLELSAYRAHSNEAICITLEYEQALILADHILRYRHLIRSPLSLRDTAAPQGGQSRAVKFVGGAEEG